MNRGEREADPGLCGSGDWIRTGDTPGMNRMLWPTELRRHMPRIIQNHTIPVNSFFRWPQVVRPAASGRGRRLRTLGLRFWRPPLYQLSYSPILNWWTVRDSNPGPTGYEPVALPTELTVRNRNAATIQWRHFRLAPPVGFEPTTLRLTAACSTG